MVSRSWERPKANNKRQPRAEGVVEIGVRAAAINVLRGERKGVNGDKLVKFRLGLGLAKSRLRCGVFLGRVVRFWQGGFSTVEAVK